MTLGYFYVMKNILIGFLDFEVSIATNGFLGLDFIGPEILNETLAYAVQFNNYNHDLDVYGTDAGRRNITVADANFGLQIIEAGYLKPDSPDRYGYYLVCTKLQDGDGYLS